MDLILLILFLMIFVREVRKTRKYTASYVERLPVTEEQRRFFASLKPGDVIRIKRIDPQ